MFGLLERGLVLTLNRAERRKQGIKTPPQKKVHLNEDAYYKALDDAFRRGFDDGVRKTFYLASQKSVYFMLCLPLLVLKEKFREVWRKEFDGVSREQHFFDLCLEVYEQYDNGQDTLDRLLNDTKEKTGVDVAKKVDE